MKRSLASSTILLIAIAVIAGNAHSAVVRKTAVKTIPPVKASDAAILETYILPAKGGFSNTKSDYKIFKDPGSKQGDNYTVYITGPKHDSAIKTKYEVFFRTIDEGTPKCWRVGMYSGCISVDSDGHNFICSFIAPTSLLETGNFGKNKVQVMVGKYSNTKEYSHSTMPATYCLSSDSANEIKAEPHTPTFMIGPNTPNCTVAAEGECLD